MFGVDDAAAALIIAGLMSSAGSIYNNQRQISMTRDINAANRQLAMFNNQMEVNLANTAHQREVADLRAAGLNPILSAGGSGSSTPHLSGANLDVARTENPLEGLASSARSAARYLSDSYDTQLKQQKADVRLTEQQERALTFANFENQENSALARQEAEADREGLLRAMGYSGPKYTSDGTKYRTRDDKQYEKYIKEVASGYMASAKMRANQNWRTHVNDVMKWTSSASDVLSAAAGGGKKGWLKGLQKFVVRP